MKRSLQVLGEPTDSAPAAQTYVVLGQTALSIADAHDGRAAAAFGELLVEAGAIRASSEASPDLHIVIRSTPQSAEARLRAAVLEDSADLVLGSPRPAAALLLAKALTPGSG